MYLGLATNETEVGYYTTATKLYTIIMAVFTAFTGVMMPRMSSLIASNQIDDFKKLTIKSIDILFAFTIPLIIISEYCAPQIIQILAGDGYEGAILPMRIIMPLMLIIGYEQIIILQILTPMKKDSAILKNSSIGAIVGLLLNFLLVSRIGSVGSSLVLFTSEMFVLLSAQYFVFKYIKFRMPIKALIKRMLLSIPILMLCYIIELNINNVFFSLLTISTFVILYWLMIEVYFMQNSVLSDIFNRIIYNSNFRNNN